MISVFDMFSIGIGLLLFYIVGLMCVLCLFVNELEEKNIFINVIDIKVELFGLLG